MAQKKSASKNTSKNKKTPKKSNGGSVARKTEQKGHNLAREIKGVVFLFSGIFLAFCVASGSGGVIGSAVSDFMIRLLGKTGSLIFSFAVFLHGVLLMFQFEPFTAYSGAVYLYIMVLNIVTVIAFYEQKTELFSLLDKPFYRYIWLNPTLGGFIGQFLAKLYVSLLSQIGAWLFVICVSVIAFILIFRNSIVAVMRRRMDSRKERKAGARRQAAQRLMSEQAKTQSDEVLFIERNKKEKLLKSRFSGLDETIAAVQSENKPSRLGLLNIFDENAEPQANPAHLKEGVTSPQKPENTGKAEALKGEHGSESEKQAKPHAAYQFPPLRLLDSASSKSTGAQKQEVVANAAHLEKTLSEFGIEANVSEICMGPTVTRYELQLHPGIRVSKVVSLSDDIAMALAAQRVRIEAPIPGKSAIGIEVPNKEIAIVKLSQIIDTKEFKDNKSPLAVALGKKLSGDDLIMDIAKMPHVLIAGATGSGKSVCINAIIASILFHSPPEDVRMILIDPKMVELNVYNQIPHLLVPVVTDPKHAAGALAWAVREMTSRYEAFAENRVRDITGYNEKMRMDGGEHFPHIVLIIDELSDLMMVSAQQVENSICRLAQLARAAGIHLVLATQRPSVNVITGLIKANIPSRISFAVTSQTDSRTILDMGGAEKLLGRGDMLYYPSGESKPLRAQCAYISDKEVERLVAFVKNQQTAEYDDNVMENIKTGTEGGAGLKSGEFDDELLPRAMEIAFERGEISTSTIQRKLKLGYARAGRIIDEMEERGFISASQGAKPRSLLITQEDFCSGQRTDSRQGV